MGQLLRFGFVSPSFLIETTSAYSFAGPGGMAVLLQCVFKAFHFSLTFLFSRLRFSDLKLRKPYKWQRLVASVLPFGLNAFANIDVFG